tara:strand:+ start:193 stop:1656 length:1464 start_codon:yes stop_codon:yes gene_type:complete
MNVLRLNLKNILILTLVVTLSFGVLVPARKASAAVTPGLGPVISNTGQTAINTSISAKMESVQTGLATSLNLKELALDGIAYGLARTIIKNMVRSIVTWINSGFQGSPAFVTDLGGFLRDVADQVAGEAIYSSDLNFLCSPFELDIRTALATQYNEERDGYQPQCTLSSVTNNLEGFLAGDFSQGGWPAWFELTQGRANDPNNAYFEAKAAVDAKIRNAQGQEIKLLEFGDGFKSFKTCSDTDAASGTQKNCIITTPGTVIANQLNKALGAGQDSLITADEVNEVIGALLSQLAQQALSGTNGLLGLGGGGSYTDYGFGDSTDQSYLDALVDEIEKSPFGDITSSVVQGDIDRYKRYQKEHEDGLTLIADFTTYYNDEKKRFAEKGCSIPSYPSTFSSWEADANAAVSQSELTIAVLEAIKAKLADDNLSIEEKAKIVSDYTEMQNAGILISEVDVAEAELYYEFEVITLIAETRRLMEEEWDSCSS